MIDALLINPGGSEEIYQELGNQLTAKEQPMWVRLIAGYLYDKGFNVRIIDADAERLSYEQVAALVESYDPRYVGMVVYGHQPSASTQQMLAAGKTCTAIKDRCPDIPVVIMGGHPSALPQRTFEEEDVDYVAVGEGAVTLLDLLNGEEYVRGAWPNPAPPTLSCDELHGNMWHLLPMDKYRAHNWQTDERQPYASIYTSLQCPFKCNFCCINAPFGGTGYRTRDPQDVIDEIAMLHDRYGVKTFKIIDEMFVLKPSHYLPICEGLAKLGIDINIWAYARIDTVKKETLETLYKAGIKWLALGIESADEVVRDGAEKSLSQDDIYQIVKDIQDAGIKVIGNFIFGLPHDTMETMEDTFELARNLNCDFVNFYSAMPYPGSQLYNLANPEDLPEQWSGYSQHSIDCKPLRNEHLTAKQILEFRDDAHCRYFHDKPELAKRLTRALIDG